MNINFDGAEKTAVHTHSNVDRATTAYRSSGDTGKVSQNNIALDISGIVMDNSAYAGHGRTAEEVMQEAEQTDLTARRNYMAVMSNSMSDEDFARLQKEGFHPGSTEIETVVTIVDHIKAALVKGGVQVVGYTDTLEEEVLEDITGSPALARELKAQFEKHDIPLTRENVQTAAEAYHRLEDVKELSDGSVKYMIENQLLPTAENLYLAQFSAMKDGSRQGKGYYAAGDVAGYLARKPETVDFRQLRPQMERVIEEAGSSVGQDTLEDAEWLVEMGIPLNADTFSRLRQLKALSLPETEADFAAAAAAAIADGIPPARADLNQKQSIVERAVKLEEQVRELDERAVDRIQVRNLPFNLKNLFRISAELKNGGEPQQNPYENLRGRRMLEEVRLSMTVSANIRLLRSGFQIETAPMEDLITRLKNAEERFDKALVQEENPTAAKEKSDWYSRTLFALEKIRSAPAAVVAEVSEANTLPEVEALGQAWESRYRKAGESYETLMTAPRKDMGDSIQKAFRNVDDILADMDREITAENRKVIRILGYNSMEMTEDNFEAVRHSAALLTEVVDGLKPQRVLSMIREGVNPLTMSLEELKDYLDSQPQDAAQEMESYSRFLYKLERKNGISEEERSAYVGIYRLLRQIEKGDGGAVGAIAKAGIDQSLQNLLTAVRSSKKKHMDYRIDNSFGGRTPRNAGISSITEQIEKGYVRTPEELESALEDEDTEAVQEELDRMLFQQVRTAAVSEEAVLRHLMDYGQPATADNLTAMKQMLNGGGEVFRQLRRFSHREEEEQETSFVEHLTDSESAEEGYEAMTQRMQQTLEREAFGRQAGAPDVRTMSELYKQLGFLKSMAREENFEIPVDINGTVTAINLKMIHRKGQDSRVAISLETESLGKHTAEFTLTKEGLSGYGISEKEEGTRLLSESNELLQELLSRENVETGDIRFMTGERMNLEEFSLKAGKDRIQGQTPEALYRAAKAYIGYIQQISR